MNPRTGAKVLTILVLFVALKAVGNLFMAWGMKRFPQTMSANPIPYIQAMFDPFVALGVVALIWLC
jgi:hypothetical protein